MPCCSTWISFWIIHLFIPILCITFSSVSTFPYWWAGIWIVSVQWNSKAKWVKRKAYTPYCLIFQGHPKINCESSEAFPWYFLRKRKSDHKTRSLLHCRNLLIYLHCFHFEIVFFEQNELSLQQHFFEFIYLKLYFMLIFTIKVKKYTAWKVPAFGVFLIRIFRHSKWIRELDL